ncbi:MAG: Coenzyme F420 hydrogenase/dehydrogenase, beta subunit C-terminal domain [Phycisphaeraceae bacterium]|nr:Coenzyme F420 hydrogenase/dehydrogenase, beta subunit C-terminal domain [Phycisphaeraceae bacterium]
MQLKVLNIRDVAEYQLCTGCGACAYAQPDAIEMIDVLDHGRRPRLREGVDANATSSDAMRVCPGVDQSHTFDATDPALNHDLMGSWGPILGMWEGHAGDPALRFAGSSGAAASALALHSIERGGMHGLLHIKAREDVPYLNHTVMSRTREQILAATGSRYAPASPCDGLQMIEDAPAPCVFIGKPCDNVAVSKARRIRPALDEKLGLTIAFFCAGTPTVAGTIEMLQRMGVTDLSTIKSLRYRGNGWPGLATVVVETESGAEDSRTLTYAQSWGEVLSRNKQWRCNLCPDRTGEFADVSVGDPWYQGVTEGDPGRSLIIARTERGRRAILDAIADGYLVATPAEDWKLPASQTGFVGLRGSIWGRLLALRVAGAPRPTYRGFSMFRHWLLRIGAREMLKSFAGSLKRVRVRQLKRRHAMEPYTPTPSRVRRGSGERPPAVAHAGGEQ